MQELLYNLINRLKEPILVLQESQDSYSVAYKNEAMKLLLNADEEDSTELPKMLSSLLRLYKEKDSSYTTILNHVEIFDSLYNISFYREEKFLFVTFVKISQERMFDTLSFHDLGSNCSAMIIVLDQEGGVVDANSCFLSFMGVTKEQIVSQDFIERFIPGNKQLLMHYFEGIISESSKSQHFITPLKNGQGEVFKVNWQLSKIVRQEKQFLIAIGSDISRILDKSNRYKRELESIKIGFEYFPHAVAYMDADGLFTSMNKMFMKMFHVDTEQEKTYFDDITFFRKNIGFVSMLNNIRLIKDMSYKIAHPYKGGSINIKIDIKMLTTKESTPKLFIITAQKLH